MLSLRPVVVPDDYPCIAEILTLTGDTPVTADRLAANDANLPATTRRHRLVAVNPDGTIVAYGVASHGGFSKPGRFGVRVFTHPAFRRKGAGSTLWEALVAFVREQGGTSLTTAAHDNDQDAIAFIEKRGFNQVRHIFESQTDLTEHDGSAYAHVVTALEAAGIRFFTLAEQPGEETERALYTVDSLVAWDNPGDDIGEFPSFEDWRKMLLRRDGQRPEFIGIAADGERVVGFTTMYPTTVADLMDIGFTGVLREYRGRGIALALKVRAAQVALRFGAKAIRTGNDSRNAPMLAVNEKLGYKRLPGRFEYERAL
jgi:GNAT superfamily N-acetyltransferase